LPSPLGEWVKDERLDHSSGLYGATMCGKTHSAISAY
jgi:hypothetical protein